MPSKKKTKKLPITRIAILIGAMLLVAVSSGYLIQKNIDQRTLSEQKARLDSAEKDITSITNQFLAKFAPIDINHKEFKKECNESSTKYGRGTITCGPRLFVRIFSNDSIEQLSHNEAIIKSSVEGVGRFSEQGKPFLDAETRSEGRVYEITSSYMDNEKTSCYFTSHIYTNEQYLQAHRGESPTGSSVMTLSSGCNETTKEPIYPLVN